MYYTNSRRLKGDKIKSARTVQVGKVSPSWSWLVWMMAGFIAEKCLSCSSLCSKFWTGRKLMWTCTLRLWQASHLPRSPATEINNCYNNRRCQRFSFHCSKTAAGILLIYFSWRVGKIEFLKRLRSRKLEQYFWKAAARRNETSELQSYRFQCKEKCTRFCIL